MIACVSFSPGFIIMLLAPIALCYISTCYDVLTLICDKQKSMGSILVRNIPVVAVCAFYLIQIYNDPFIFLICGFPIIVALITYSIQLMKESEKQTFR